MPEEGKKVIKDREAYRDAWARTGEWLNPMGKEINALLTVYPRMYLPFIMIVNKLMRVLADPTNIDHWLDISGYAELVVKDLRNQNQN
jgi:hypothetical protein